MYSLLPRFRSFIRTSHFFKYYLRVDWVALRPLFIPALTVGTFALGAVSGLLATRLDSKKVQVGLAGLFGFLVAFYRPDLTILLILAMSSTIIDRGLLPRLYGFTAIEMCLMLLLGLVVTRVLANKKGDEFVHTPLDWPVFLFFAASTISLFNAKYNLGTVDTFFNPVWQTLLNYMVFFAVTNYIRTRRQLMTLVGGMFVMATIVAALMVAQQAVGSRVSIIPGREGMYNATALGQELVGAARVAIPGSAIVYVMLLPAFILHTTPEYLKTRKWASFIPVILFPLAILFTFTRSLWIGAVLSGAIFVITARFQSMNFIWLLLLLVIATVFLVPLLNAYFPRVGTVTDALSLRASSLLAGDELVYDASTQGRLRENELATPKFQEYPILGIGPNGMYRAPRTEEDTYYNYARCRYVHNSYLYLLVDVGIVGFLPFVWFSLLHLFRGFSSWHTIRDPVLKALVMGFTVSYIAVLSTSATSPRLLENHYVPLIGVMLGVNAVAIRLGQPVLQERKWSQAHL